MTHTATDPTTHTYIAVVAVLGDCSGGAIYTDHFSDNYFYLWDFKLLHSASLLFYTVSSLLLSENFINSLILWEGPGPGCRVCFFSCASEGKVRHKQLLSVHIKRSTTSC